MYNFKDIQEPFEKYFFAQWPYRSIDSQDKQSTEETEEYEENKIISMTEQFKMLNFYLRQTYNYCVYWGTVYNN